MTILLYCRRKEWPVEGVTVECSHRRAAGGEAEGPYDEIRCRILLEGNITDERRDRILRIAGRCPVRRTLESKPRIVEEIEVVSRP